ncbi:MAG: hypothetical protein AAF725_26465, partial [Acidobacteriota bacterium]
MGYVTCAGRQSIGSIVSSARQFAKLKERLLTDPAAPAEEWERFFYLLEQAEKNRRLLEEYSRERHWQSAPEEWAASS